MSFAKLLSGKVAKVKGSDLSPDRYDYIQVSEAEPDFGIPLSDNGIFSSRLTGERRFLFPSTGLVVDDVTGNIEVDYSAAGNESFGTVEVIDTDSGYTWSPTGSVSATTNSDTIKFVSGSYLDIDADTTNGAIRVSHNTTTRTDTTSTESPSAGTDFDVVDSITTNASGHLTAVNLKTVTLPPSATYNISAESPSSNAVIRLTGSDASTDDVEIVGSGITTVSRTDADTITITSTEADTIDSVTGRGNTTTNSISVGSITLNENTVIDTVSTILATTTETALNLYNIAKYSSAKLLVDVYDTITGDRQMSELLVVHNGVSAKSTEYGIVFTGISSLATFDVDLVSGSVRLLITSSSTNNTEYKITEILTAL